MSDDKAFLLELSTAVVETELFTVDGNEYELLGLNHLSEDDEIAVMALFARFESLSELLGQQTKKAKAEDVARAMRVKRLELLAKMTTCPIGTLGELPLSSQIQLMEHIGREFGEASKVDDGD